MQQASGVDDTACVLLPLQVIFLSQVYTSVNGSFQEGPAERPLPITTIILIVVVSTLGVVLLIIFISAVIFFCRRGMGKRPASSKNKVSNSSEPIELQPQSGNLLDATEDAGIVYYRVLAINCTVHVCEVARGLWGM